MVIALAGAIVLTGVAGLGLAQEEPTATPADNETGTDASTPIDQHEDPRNASEQGDVGQLSDWLSGHLSDRLEGGVVELSQGQYDEVEGLVGDEFESRLSQFVDVAGETNAEGDDETAESMQAVAEEQREFGGDVQRYRETFEEYREARERGDNDAAREHARDLEDLAGDVESNGDAVRDGYRTIGNATDQDLTEGIGAVDDIVTNVSTTQEEVREVTFVATELSATANRSVAAFDSPATIDGQVVAENGSVLASRSITIAVAGRESTVTTDAEGRFSAVYRPVTVATEVDSVPVRYRPRPDAAYLDSQVNVSLGIESVEPTVSISSFPESASFGDEVPIDATVHVDDHPVPGAPVSVAIDGRTLAVSNASASGELQAAPTLPADVESGDRTVRVTAGVDGRAISPGKATESVRIEQTPTNLSVDADTVGGDLVIGGTLSTTEGAGVPNRTIVVEAGSTSETVSTNASGAYETTLEGESLGDPEEDVSVMATFGGEGTNLDGATASTTAVVPGDAGDAGSSSLLDAVPWVVVAGAIVALALLVGVVVLFLRWNRSPEDGSPEPGPIDSPNEFVSTSGDAEFWIDAASDALDRGDERGAVSRAYAASYARLQERLALGDDRTPRELLAAAEGRVDESVLDALASVTDAYERMAFAGSGPTGASDVLEQARIVVEERSTGLSSDDD